MPLSTRQKVWASILLATAAASAAAQTERVQIPPIPPTLKGLPPLDPSMALKLPEAPLSWAPTDKSKVVPPSAKPAPLAPPAPAKSSRAAPPRKLAACKITLGSNSERLTATPVSTVLTVSYRGDSQCLIAVAADSAWAEASLRTSSRQVRVKVDENTGTEPRTARVYLATVDGSLEFEVTQAAPEPAPVAPLPVPAAEPPPEDPTTAPVLAAAEEPTSPASVEPALEAPLVVELTQVERPHFIPLSSPSAVVGTTLVTPSDTVVPPAPELTSEPDPELGAGTGTSEPPAAAPALVAREPLANTPPVLVPDKVTPPAAPEGAPEGYEELTLGDEPGTAASASAGTSNGPRLDNPVQELRGGRALPMAKRLLNLFH